jgi:hypothetical protein
MEKEGLIPTSIVRCTYIWELLQAVSKKFKCSWHFGAAPLVAIVNPFLRITADD